MKKLLYASTLTALLAQAANAQNTTPIFTPGKIAVLQISDGGPGRCQYSSGSYGVGTITNYNVSDMQGSRQNALFIDQFDTATMNQSTPTVQVAIPTNAAVGAALNGGLFLNGNAGTEGCLSLAGDKSSLVFAGYAGTVLSITTGGSTAPSNLSYDRGVGLVDACGNYTNVYHGPAWYGIATGKTNPRGVATDGTNQFWGCGNGYGSLYFDFTTQEGPDIFQNVDLTSYVRVQNNTLLATVKGGDVQNTFYPAGLYSFVDFFNNPAPYPTTASYLNLIVPASGKYTNCIGFDINPAGNTLYMADSKLGLQKYVKNGSAWALAYNLSIPGYNNQTNSGILTNATSTKVITGLFSITVDWTSTYPQIYATTEDNSLYGNRVIRINDTNTVTTGVNLTNITIITNIVVPPNYATATMVTNISFKSVAFTPDWRPLVTASPVSWSAVVGDTVGFSVTANSPYTSLNPALYYQWLSNGVPVAGATASSLSVGPVALGYNGSAFSCQVSNAYGAVTSSVATLAVSATASAPTLPAAVNVTNLLGSTFTLTQTATGTDPKTYAWYFGGNPLSDGVNGDGSGYYGTGTSTLTISNALNAEAGAYSLKAANVQGSITQVVDNVYLNLAAPVFVVTPASTTTFTNSSVSLSTVGYGLNLSYYWYTSSNATSVVRPVPVQNTGDISGAQTATLTFSAAAFSDATNYFVVISNATAAITSAPVTLTVITAPPASFVNYAKAGSNYFQNFDTLPINGGSSADAANPNSITVIPPAFALTNNGDFTALNNTVYSLPNTFDFAYPALAQGFIGGLGLSNTLNGWYGWASTKMQFGATYGDQTGAGIIDLGQNFITSAYPLAGVTNRALGLITSTKSGSLAFGVKLINNSGSTLDTVNLSFVGELWRNNGNQQVLDFSYALDAAGTNSVFNPGTLTLNPVNSLNVSFPTSSASTILDGTQPTNQVNLASGYLTLASPWTPGSALWLVWASSIGTGGSQEVAIDNLSFTGLSSTTAPLSIVVSGGNAIVSWPTYGSLNVLQTSSTAHPASWSNVTNPIVPVGGYNTVTVPVSGSAAYFRLAQH